MQILKCLKILPKLPWPFKNVQNLLIKCQLITTHIKILIRVLLLPLIEKVLLKNVLQIARQLKWDLWDGFKFEAWALILAQSFSSMHLNLHFLLQLFLLLFDSTLNSSFRVFHLFSMILKWGDTTSSHRAGKIWSNFQVIEFLKESNFNLTQL